MTVTRGAERFRPDMPATGDRGPASDPGKAWRTSLRDDVSPETLAVLRERLARVSILGQPRWRAAVEGDVAAAVGIGIDHLFSGEIATTRTDLVMSLLLTMAAGGSPAAELVLRHGRKLAEGGSPPG